MESKVYFVELNDKERESKLRLINESEVLVWQNMDSGLPFEHRSTSLFLNDSYIGLREDHASFKKGERYLIRFEVSNTIYFSTASWLGEKDESPYPFHLEVDRKVYRYEKRAGDRLLAYPHRSVFLKLHQDHIEKEKLDTSNIIPFDKSESTLIRLYEELNDSESQGDILLRVIDISEKGFAFFAGAKECEIFRKEGYDTLSILFDGEEFAITLNEILYEVEFLDALTRKSGYRKVGVTYSTSSSLGKKISRLLDGEEIDRIDVKGNFEAFLMER